MSAHFFDFSTAAGLGRQSESVAARLILEKSMKKGPSLGQPCKRFVE